MSAIIKLVDVNLWYDKGKPTEVHALKGINLEIEKGDYVAFFGPSGCGKTTILYAFSGIDRAQSGKIFVNGKDIAGLSSTELAIFRQTNIGIIFQQFNILPSLTVLQNVALPMSFVGKGVKESEEEAMKLLKRLDIDDYAHRYQFELSGGQQQRVGIARALANDPQVIVADEPLGNLDSANANNVLEFLRELNEKDGKTVIMVTHESWSLQDVKTIHYMKDGMITGTKVQTPKPKTDVISAHLANEIDPAKKEAELLRDELSARVLSNFLLRGYSMDEVRRFEVHLKQRLRGQIRTKDFEEILDKPFKDGGVGLWKGKAKRLAEYVEGIVEKRHDIHAVLQIIEKHPELAIADEVRQIRDWLLLDYKSKVSSEKALALDQAVSDRMRNYISAKQFMEVLDMPERRNGVGLSFRTAERLSEKMETIMSGAETIAGPLAL
ncbi:MAG: ABC transporter ATP-binding protein [bacterium]|nr:ABC transporter ATP-binding protein [bacterium]